MTVKIRAYTEDIKKLYIVDKLTYEEISHIYNCCKQTIANELKRQGIKRKHRNIILNTEEIVRLYIEEKMSSTKIARMFGCSGYTILYELRNAGVAIRKTSETVKLSGIKKGRYIGGDNPNWKGGKRRNGGYIYIHSPNHPRTLKRNNSRHPSTLIAEHILIWEKENGKYLPEDWVVHHINGIKDDNRIVNLIATPKKNHSPALNIKAIQKRLRDVEAELFKVKSQLKLEI